MYISKKDREKIKQKYGGRCAYSGTILESDWQVDHIVPVIRNWWTSDCESPESHKLENMVPTQKIINHYKGSLSLEMFRDWYLGGLHQRLRKLPKNPRTEKSIKKKEYLIKVAGYFGITPDAPFTGLFYMELESAEG